MNIKPLVKTSEILVQELENELLVYDLQTNKAFCLNETSAIVFQLCDGTKTVAEISHSIAKKTNQPITEDLVWLALDGLKKDKLLEESERFEINFNGLNRRQVIRKLGLASLIALPLVSSVIAPTAANAQSSCQAPGTIFPDLCSINPSTCNLNPNVFRCCSGMATSVSQPCPVLTTLQFACACA
jgi:hypothetical protein